MSHEVYAPPIKLENETLPAGLREVFRQAEMLHKVSAHRTAVYFYAKHYDALASHLFHRYGKDGMGRPIKGARPIERATFYGLPIARLGA